MCLFEKLSNLSTRCRKTMGRSICSLNSSYSIHTGKIKMSDYNQQEIFRKMGQLNCKAAEVFTVKEKVQHGVLFSVLKLPGSLPLNFN